MGDCVRLCVFVGDCVELCVFVCDCMLSHSFADFAMSAISCDSSDGAGGSSTSGLPVPVRVSSVTSSALCSTCLSLSGQARSTIGV